MFHALLGRKLRRDFVRPAADIEDLLTSVVFGACLYCGDPRVALVPFLGRARTLEGELLSDAIHDVTSASYDFWPPWDPAFAGHVPVGEGGEPDLVLELDHATGLRSLVVVEAKLWSKKSSTPTNHGPVTDQLGKYWLGSKQRAQELQRRPLGVVYVTSSSTPPIAELAATKAELLAKTREAPPIYWLSWRHFTDVVSADAAPLLRDAAKLVRDEWKLTHVEMTQWPPPIEAPATMWSFEPDWGPFEWPSSAPLAWRWSFEVEILWPSAGPPRGRLPWNFATEGAT